MVPGPNGSQVYAPIGYYAPPSPEYARSPSGSKAGSRSGSKHSRRESTPPERTDPYAYPPRYYPPPPGMRPESSHSNRSLPDDPDWYPPQPRNRSASNAGPYAAYPPPADYDPPLTMPAAQGQRRNVSGPADVRYASLRRVPPSSPLAPRRPEPHAAYSDPVAQGRRGSLLAQQSRDVDASSSSSSDDQGVQVDILPDAAGGYSISRAPAEQVRPAQPPPPPAPSGNEGRRRKGRR